MTALDIQPSGRSTASPFFQTEYDLEEETWPSALSEGQKKAPCGASWCKEALRRLDKRNRYLYGTDFRGGVKMVLKSSADGCLFGAERHLVQFFPNGIRFNCPFIGAKGITAVSHGERYHHAPKKRSPNLDERGLACDTKWS